MSQIVKSFPVLYKQTSHLEQQEWKIWVVPKTDGTAELCIRFGLTAGKKQETVEVIKAGKNAGKKNATSAFQQACLEAESRWTIKQKRKGYALDVAASAAILGTSPMLAKKYQDCYKKVDWGTAFAQPKLDGYRLMARIKADGTVELTSRENQPMPAMVHIQELLRGVKPEHVGATKGEDLIIDGEAYCHGMTLQQVSSACKRKSALSAKVQYHVYDAMLPGQPFENRSMFVKNLTEVIGESAIVAVETIKVRSEGELQHCEREFLDQKFEGAMLRHSRKGYEAGKRASQLLKVKTFVDGEFEIVDFKFGRGKFSKVPVFVCVTDAGHHFDVTAPGSMPEKEALGLAAKQQIGKQLTVKYAYMTKTEEPVPFQPVGKIIN